MKGIRFIRTCKICKEEVKGHFKTEQKLRKFESRVMWKNKLIEKLT